MDLRDYTAEDVTLAVMNYNGADRLPDLLRSISDLNHEPGEVMLVDDGSTDGGADAAEREHPNLKVVRMGRNTTILNKVRNRAFQESSKPLVFIVDNDVVLTPACLDELLLVINTWPKCAACMTRATYADRPDLIYQDGQVLHYVGASPGTNREKRVSEADTEPRVSIGWGVQLIDKRAAEQVGFFNEEYLLGWGDDGEINHKLNLFGFRCYHVPRSVVLHKRFESSKRYYAAVRNRLRFIFEMYYWRTIVLALPALAVYEVSLFAFLALKGGIRDYFRGWAYFFTHLPDILRVRRQIQSTRQLKDSEVMGAGDIFVYSDYVDIRILAVGYKAMNVFLNLYWALIRRF
ncbi:MAG: glycosyltransferase, partial [Gammaproteobacteria bacterium]|nr:glycosyltransferase [Gammaproteobacteria bacterium]